jgi:hypothetical protein
MSSYSKGYQGKRSSSAGCSVLSGAALVMLSSSLYVTKMEVNQTGFGFDSSSVNASPCLLLTLKFVLLMCIDS